MNRLKAITIILLMFLINSCGSVDLFVKPGTSFNKQTTITVLGSDYDGSNTKGQLEFLLLSRGFNIVSESAAKTAIRYKDKLQGSDRFNNEFSAEVYSIKSLNSIYAMQTNYTSYYDMFFYAYRNFTAKIIDLNTGEIVLTVNFSGDRAVSSVLESLANQLSALIK